MDTEVVSNSSVLLFTISHSWNILIQCLCVHVKVSR